MGLGKKLGYLVTLKSQKVIKPEICEFLSLVHSLSVF